MRSSRLLVFVLAALFAAPVCADVSLPSVINDHMVLQRDMEAPIWGKADPGEKVTVRLGDDEWSTTAGEDGKWLVKLGPLPAGGPMDMTITGRHTVLIKDVLIGEVWVCSGQSNMQMSVRGSNDAEQEIAAAKYPNIRLCSVTRAVSEEPQEDCVSSWSPCTPETIPHFTAVGYFFGRALHQALNVPVGLIHTSWGGTPAEAWTSRPMLESDPDFAAILERWHTAVENYPANMEKYQQKVEEWKVAVEKAKAEGKPAPGRPGAPFGPGHPHTPSGLSGAMIHPLLPYGIKGAIWYQGESNAGRARQYTKVFRAMILDWRQSWGQGDFPFLFVQLANFMARKPDPADSAWAELREAQTKTLSLPNAGMAVIIDVGEATDIHPKNKQDVGARLALAGQAVAYGQDIVYSGPMLQAMAVEGNKARLTFDHVGGGLVAQGGGPLKGFAVAGEDRTFVWADATIDGDAVVVESAQVANPVAVRYAWADNPECNLYNKEGLPASPFRTDEWPGVTWENR